MRPFPLSEESDIDAFERVNDLVRAINEESFEVDPDGFEVQDLAAGYWTSPSRKELIRWRSSMNWR